MSINPPRTDRPSLSPPNFTSLHSSSKQNFPRTERPVSVSILPSNKRRPKSQCTVCGSSHSVIKGRLITHGPLNNRCIGSGTSNHSTLSPDTLCPANIPIPIQVENSQEATQSNTPHFKWGVLEGEAFIATIEMAQKEVVHWRINIFSVPSGVIGKKYIGEVTRLYDALAEKTALEPIAMSAAIVLPILLLQKPHQRSKAKEHTSCLTRRLESWLKGDINELLNEGRTIQNRLIDKQNLAKK